MTTKELTALDKINRLSHQLPLGALQDIHKRVTDWLAGGGDADDHYIHQQLRFAENVIRSEERDSKKGTKTDTA